MNQHKTRDLPLGWAEALLGELGFELRGSVTAVPGTSYELYSVPTYPTGRPEFMDGHEIGSSKRPVEPGDVLLCKINPRINRVWRVADPLDEAIPQIASTEYLAFRASEIDLGHYLVWYLRSPRFRDWIKLSVEGATGSHTRAKSGPILRQMIPVPPLNEQRRIVAAIEEHLSCLDAADASLGAAIRRLDRFRASALGLAFPSHLPRLPFSEIATVDSDLADPAEFPGLPHIAPNHIESRTGRLLEFTTVAADGVTSPKYRFQPGQVLYSKIRPYLAKAALVDFEGLCSADMYPVSTTLEPSFLRWWMLTPEFTELAAGQQGRSVLPKINRKQLDKLPIPTPPLEDQRRIVAQIEEQLSAIDALRAAIERAQRRSLSLRRAILERAFRGELVPQDPTDEPAEALLARIRTMQRAQSTGPSS